MEEKMHKWQLHEAKNKLSHLVDMAVSGEPQCVTRRGKDIAVIISMEEYLKNKNPKMDLKQLLLNNSPECEDVDFERPPAYIRELDL
jgi:antitoxin Phd